METNEAESNKRSHRRWAIIIVRLIIVMVGFYLRERAHKETLSGRQAGTGVLKSFQESTKDLGNASGPIANKGESLGSVRVDDENHNDSKMRETRNASPTGADRNRADRTVSLNNQINIKDTKRDNGSVNSFEESTRDLGNASVPVTNKGESLGSMKVDGENHNDSKIKETTSTSAKEADKIRGDRPVSPIDQINLKNSNSDPDSVKGTEKLTKRSGRSSPIAKNESSNATPGRTGSKDHTTSLPPRTNEVKLSLADNDKNMSIAQDQATQIPERRDSKIYDITVYFLLNRHTLTASERNRLENSLKSINLNNIKQFDLEGHTCCIGTTQYNQNLSVQRAEYICKLLKSDLGENRYDFKVIGWGKTKPVADNSTRDGRIKNRRVEIKMVEK